MLAAHPGESALGLSARTELCLQQEGFGLLQSGSADQPSQSQV